jgi:nucleoprotein TPR
VIQKRLDETQSQYMNRRDEQSSSINSEKHQELLRKVETLNAITDSNRVLREERDTLAIKFAALQERITKVEDELVPLQDKNRELEAKTENLVTENSSLRTEATRWRQRANALVERSNKNSPDDWKRLQSERENLAKMLQQEKDLHKKTADESGALKQEKVKIELENANIQKQVTQQQSEIKRLTDEMIQFRQSSIKVSQELLETRVRAENKDEEVKKLNEEVNSREAALNSLKEKEIQIRKIAKRYKDQYLELKNQIDSGVSVPSEQQQSADNTAAGGDTIGEPSTSIANQEQFETRIQELQQEIETIRATNTQLQQVNDELQAAINKEESCKQLLVQAKNKIAQLNEKKEQLTRENVGLKSQQDNRNDEHDQVLRALKTQFESRIQRLEKENMDLVNEKSDYMQRLNQLHRQMGSSQMASKPSTSTMEKISSDTATRTANVKPQMIAGPSQQQSATVQPWRGGNTSSGETPLASIRPISVQNSRTAAVMPTTNVSNAGSSTTPSATALVSPQQP